MILFLDFDGVLHPIHAQQDQLFCHLARLEGVLRDFPLVEIVISSTWRESHGIDELRQLFSPDVARRILGHTPVRPDQDGVPPELWAFAREAECCVWIQTQQESHRPWLALDDDASQFRPMCPMLHLVDGRSGFTEEDARALRDRIKSILKLS